MNIFDKLNHQGIPLPMVRDPKTSLGSITATLVVLSSGLCLACSILAILSVLSKLAHVFDNFAESQQAFTNAFNLSFQFFVASLGAYLGRKYQGDGKNFTLDTSTVEKPKDQ